jgi:hypothetical protein
MNNQGDSFEQRVLDVGLSLLELHVNISCNGFILNFILVLGDNPELKNLNEKIMNVIISNEKISKEKISNEIISHKKISNEKISYEKITSEKNHK